MRELHLFSGVGGGILGGMLLGHTCVCAVELEDYRRKVLLQRQRDGILPIFPIWDDIKTFDGKPWRGKVDAICGGFPCQDISCAGKGKGITGERSGLWKEMARIIREVEPGIVFVENSPMLVSRGLGVVLGDLAEMGHDAQWGVLGASDAIWLEETPCFDHERLRIFIKATNSNRMRELQSERTIQNERGWIHNGIQETSNSNEAHFEGWELSIREGEEYAAARCSSWWASEPGVDRVVHGMANRMDRLEAIGDGQVPAVVKLAWETLRQ